MIKFIDLYNEKGYVFDGLWELNQQNGYIFWFPNEQSVKITYTMPICIYTDIAEPLHLTIENNDIFSFIEHDTEDTDCGGFIFKTPKYSLTYKTHPELIDDMYAHVFYVSCKSDNALEAVCKLQIDKYGFIKIGADFYDEYEATYVNLSNFGIELPDYVQKAIYDSNVHEDYKDNILINRKFKELLSNYWDVVANKGSYKSLLNSLDWFEWGDNLRLREIWKYHNGNKFFFDDKAVCSLLENKYISALNSFIKTTYFSLYASIYGDDTSYDSEMNPNLKAVVHKWGKEDLALKISLLAEFFEVFFMPIHTSVLHGCIEDVVYTNTIKTVLGASICRTDSFMDNSYVKCNITDGSVFKLNNVSVQVTNDTVYGIKFDALKDKIHEDQISNYDVDYFGVDRFGDKGYVEDNDSIKTYAIQYYSGPGVVIPFEFTIANESSSDFIRCTKVNVISNSYEKRHTFNDIIKPIGSRYKISFNLLLKITDEFEIQFMFITAAGRTITKSVRFSVEDADNLCIQLYKVKSKDDSLGMSYEDFNDYSCNDYFFKIDSENKNNNYTQYLPYMLPDNPLYKSYDGIKLSRTVIFDLLNHNGRGKIYTDDEIKYIRNWMGKSYLEFTRVIDGKLAYLIYVSKNFFAELPWMIAIKKFNIIRNTLSFYPQFHYLKKIDGQSLDDYTISQYDALCCGAEVVVSNRSESTKFKYGHMISDVEWCFRNSTTLDKIDHTASVRQPFIAEMNDKSIDDGYYDIIFKYKLYDKTNELIIDSAFLKKSI